MVGNNEQALAAQAEALAFHRSGDHFKGLACADLVGQHRITAVDHVGNRVELMVPQYNIRVHAGEDKVLAVVLAGPGAVHLLVVLPDQLVPSILILPEPVLEGVPDGLLLLRGQGSLLDVQDPFFLAVLLHLVVDAHVPQV